MRVATTPAPSPVLDTAYLGTEGGAANISVVVYQRTHRAFANGIHTLTVFDSTTGQELPSVNSAVGTMLVIAQAEGRIFAIGGGGVNVIDAQTGRILGVIRIDALVTSLTVDESMGHLFVTTENRAMGGTPTSLLMLDAATGQLRKTIMVGPIVQVVVAEPAGHVFVGYSTGEGLGQRGFVTMLDARSGRILRTIKVGATAGPLSVDGSANRVFVSNGKALVLLDARTESTLRILPMVGAPIVDTARHHGFVGGPSGLVMLDTRSGTTLRVVPAPGRPVAIDERSGRLFLTDFGPLDAGNNYVGPGHVAVLDTGTGAFLQRLTLGHEPDKVTVDPTSGLAFVSDAADSTVTVLAATFGGRPPLPTPAAPVAPLPGTRYFPHTRHTLAGAFLAFWTRYGGTDIVGEPRTEPYTEGGSLAQYTDRFLLQEAGGQVMPAPLGQQATATRTFAPVASFPSTPARVYVAATGHSVAGRYLTYWRAHGGAALLGNPLSEVVVEGNGDGSGRRYALQWFENGRLEYHPEFAGTRYEMEIGLLGVQALQVRGWLL